MLMAPEQWRKKLGVRTIFNLLGPLANPGGTRRQLIGVFDRKWLMPMTETLKNLGTKKAWVVHGDDGLDEITVTGPTHAIMLDEEGRRRWRSFCASRILFPPIPEATDLGQYRKRLAAWMESDELEAARKPIVKALQEYGDYLEETLIDSDSDSGSSQERR